MSFYTPNQTEEVVASLTLHLSTTLDATEDTIRSSILEWIQTRNAPPAKPKAAPKAKAEEKPTAKAAPKAAAKQPPPQEEEDAPPLKVAPKAKAKAKAKAAPPPPEEEEEPETPPAKPKAKAKAKAAPPPPPPEEEEEHETPPAKPKAKAKAAPAAKCDRSVRTASGFKVCGNPAVDGGTKCEPCLKLANTKASTPAPREPAAKSAKSRVTKDRPVVDLVQVPEGDYEEYLYNPDTGIVFDPSQHNGAVGCFGELEERNEDGGVEYAFDQIYELEAHHLDLLKQWKIPQVYLDSNPEEDVNEEDDGQAIEEEDEEE